MSVTVTVNKFLRYLKFFLNKHVTYNKSWSQTAELTTITKTRYSERAL